MSGRRLFSPGVVCPQLNKDAQTWMIDCAKINYESHTGTITFSILNAKEKTWIVNGHAACIIITSLRKSVFQLIYVLLY